MSEQNYIENSFIIDLTNAKDTLQVMTELSNILDLSNTDDKNICLKLKDIELSQSQVLSIKALIQASGANLAVLDINNEKTISSANALGINISCIDSNLNIAGSEEENYREDVFNLEEKLSNNNPEVSENDSKDNSAEISIQSPEFMNIEQISKENLEETKIASDFNEIYSKNIYKNAENNISQDSEEAMCYTSESSTSEVSYKIFKTEEIENQENGELPTLYLKQTLRSGQTLCYDGNILVIGDTHPGSELIAKGDITVWGVLAGVAHAGTSGDKNARIRALKLNAIQLRIAGIYAGRENTENIPFIQRSTEFTPQEARIENDMLVVRSIINKI